MRAHSKKAKRILLIVIAALLLGLALSTAKAQDTSKSLGGARYLDSPFTEKTSDSFEFKR